MAACANANVVSETTVAASGKTLQFATFDCDAPEFARRQTEAGDLDTEVTVNTPPLPICIRHSAIADECATSCTHDSGILPPISEDCDMISTAVSLMVDQGGVPPTFNLKKWQMRTLTFGTCSYYVVHSESNCNEVTYSWEALANTGKKAGKACFPPVQPFSPEGLCKGSSGVWYAGATHS